MLRSIFFIKPLFKPLLPLVFALFFPLLFLFHLLTLCCPISRLLPLASFSKCLRFFLSFAFSPLSPPSACSHSLSLWARSSHHWSPSTPFPSSSSSFVVFPSFFFSRIFQGDRHVPNQRSRAIACYQWSIFHVLVNCFVLTLCQKKVVTDRKSAV